MCIGVTKEYKPKEFARILLNNGFVYDGSTGGHRHYKRNKELVVISTTKINKMIARRLIKEHKLMIK